MKMIDFVVFLFFEVTPIAMGRDPNNQIPCVAEEFIPVLGMLFDDLKSGLNFYRKYAEVSGFMTRLDLEKTRDSVITYKRCVCNKAGYSKPTGKQRKVPMTRVGCKALIVFKRVVEVVGEEEIVKYSVATFNEGHSHPLNTPTTMVHLKQSRDLNVVHKKMIIDNAKVNYGATKSYKMFKEHVCGFNNIGASLVDFKNFSRDVKKFFKEYDAQMLIESFIQKKAMNSSFYFDFDVDEDSNLCRLFWADATAIKNYILFGDPVSFDTTFSKNSYRMVFAPFTGMDNHKRCVTFGAGLISKENAESFAWLFTTFMKAMGGRYPKFIITDQDLGIKAGIEKVFGEHTLHKFCIWHIMKKVSDNVDSLICKTTDFLKDINACVWDDEIGPLEFEEKWDLMILKYDLGGNKWLDDIHKICTYWVPAYSRDVPLRGLMRTTSRSESENSFFGNFTNPHLSLVEFYMRFESAMDAQRWKHSKLVADSKNSTPRLRTPLPLEEHASNIYTPVVFYEFQEEVEAACFRCGFKNTTTVGLVDNITIMDHEQNKNYIVEFHSNLVPDEQTLVCSCKKFLRDGILCRHAICVLKDKGFNEVPKEYLMTRWSKNATCKPVFNVDGTLLVDSMSLDSKKRKFGELWSEIFTCVSMVEEDEENANKLLELVRGFKENLPQPKVNRASEDGKSKKKNKMAELEILLGTKIPKEVTILPPKHCKNKGSGRSGRRFISEKEKAVQEQKRGKRKCNFCGEMGYHDLRNCPARLNKKHVRNNLYESTC